MKRSLGPDAARELHEPRRVPLTLPMLLVMLFVSAQASAQTRQLSLREAIVLAVRHNPVLAAAGAGMRIAEADTFSARGLDDLVVEAGVDWRDTRLDAVSVGPAR